MGIHPHEEGSGDAFGPAMFDDCLSDCGNMVVVKTDIGRGAAMPGCTKSDFLADLVWVGV